MLEDVMAPIPAQRKKALNQPSALAFAQARECSL